MYVWNPAKSGAAGLPALMIYEGGSYGLFTLYPAQGEQHAGEL